MGENFQLKERIDALEGDVKRLEGEKDDLKERVKVLLEELASNDKEIDIVRRDGQQLHYHILELEDKNTEL